MGRTGVRAEAVEHVNHAVGLVRLAEDGQLLACKVEHRALAAPARRALPAARLHPQHSMR